MTTPWASLQRALGRVRHAGRVLSAVVVLVMAAAGWPVAAQPAADLATDPPPAYAVQPIGWIRKAAGRTWIAVEERYRPALLGVGELASIWVLWWFHLNDDPASRAVLQVHPRGDPDRPLRGVFATRSPYRPNLIALSRVRVLSVRDNVIEIDDIDAFADTPVLDLKP